MSSPPFSSSSNVNFSTPTPIPFPPITSDGQKPSGFSGPSGIAKPLDQLDQPEKLSTVQHVLGSAGVSSLALTVPTSSIALGTVQPIKQSDPLFATTAESVPIPRAVKSVISATATPASNHVGETPLMFAVSCGDDETVKRLIEETDPKCFNEYLNRQNHHGMTPLMAAAMKGYKEIVQLLIERADPVHLAQFLKASSKYGDTALMLAVQYGRKDIVKVLIRALDDAGLNPHDYINAQNKNHGMTPLMIAAMKGYEEIVELLIKKGDPNSKVDPTFLAELLNASNHNGDTVFTFAIMNKKGKEIIALIRALSAGMNLDCDLNIKNKKMQNLLMLAVRGGNKEVVELLLKKDDPTSKVDPTVLARLLYTRDNNGDTVFTLAAKNERRKETIEVLMQALIRADINPNYYLNVKNNKGETPLMLAAKGGYEETVKLLLTKAGVNLNIKDNNDYTALMHAAQNGKWEIVEWLTRYGANFSDVHQVLADEIAERGHPSSPLAQDLIEHGASLKTAETIKAIKAWAHMWGLKGDFTTKDENGVDITFPLEGMSQRFMLRTFINDVAKFYEKTDLTSPNLKLLKDKQAEIQTSLENIENILFESSSNIDPTIITTIQSGRGFRPILLAAGCERHAITMSIYHTENGVELMICNRGEGAHKDASGNAIIKRYAFPKISDINEEMIKKLTEKYNNMQEFNDMISKTVVQLSDDVSDDDLVQKLQKVGNCSWASAKGIIAMLLIAHTLNLKTPEEFSRILLIKNAYKEFTAWARAEAVREMLRSNPPQGLVLLVLEKYINKFLKGSSSPDRKLMVEELIGKMKPDVASVSASASVSALASSERIAAINTLVSLLGERGASARPGIQEIGVLLEGWLKDQIPGEVEGIQEVQR